MQIKREGPGGVDGEEEEEEEEEEGVGWHAWPREVE